jgi:hypothetical protein
VPNDTGTLLQQDSGHGHQEIHTAAIHRLRYAIFLMMGLDLESLH